MTSHTAVQTTGLSRRKFVIGAATTSVALGAMQGVATAQELAQDEGSNADGTHVCDGVCATITVWRLDADWGYPRGPHAKTKLESRASRNAAKNRWALTEQDALDMNLHLCSWAPAIPVEVQECAFMEIWNHNGAGSYAWTNPWNDATVQIFDERCLPHIDESGELWEQALNPTCTTPKESLSSEPLEEEAVREQVTNRSTGSASSLFSNASTTLNGSGTVVPRPSRGPVRPSTPRSTTPVERRTTSSSTRPAFGGAPTQLAFTGSETPLVAGAGIALLVSGAALRKFSERKQRVAEFNADQG